MWPPDGRRNEGTAEEHAIVLFDSLPVQAFFSWLGSFTAQPRRDTHGHQNVPSARFSRCAHGLSSLGLRNAKKETPSKRMVFLFLERATGKPPKRCLWQNKRGGFKEVSQWPVPERGRALADTTRAQLRRMQRFSFDAPSAKFTATWLGSLTAHSAVTRTRAPKRATGTFSRFARALFEPRPTLYQKRSTILLDDASFLERATRLELATSTLARSRSTR